METKIPVTKNEFYEIDIDGLGHEGEGVGRIENFTVFVPLSLPGDKAKIKIVKVKKSHAYGKLIEIIKPSENRQEPICQVFDKCGGCSLQHIQYGKQLELKKKIVEDALLRLGKLKDVIVHDTIGMDNTYRYRNKAQFPISGGKQNEEIQIGFYAPRSHEIVAIDKCFLQHEVNDEIIALVKGWMRKYNVSAYDEATGKGLVRHVFTRVGFKSGEVMLVIVTNSKELPYKKDLIDALRNGQSNLVSVVQNINNKRTNVVLGGENIVLWGRDYIVDFIEDIKFKISPLSFYQVNPIQTEVLYNKALEFAKLNAEETVFDLYCGIGTISLFLARKVKKVIGVELVKEAIVDAKNNADLNGINNVEFHVGAAEDVVSRLYSEGVNADVVVIDPPRKGCDEVLLDVIVKIEPKRVVYVSCNPATLARDLRYLEDRGYKTVEVQPVDMFPQTAHVECCCLLSRADK